MMPLLVEGTQLKCVLWGGRDVETLKSKLPSLRDGANRWIATFEDETVRDMIAVGDIKVLQQLKKDKKLKGTYVVRGEAGGSEESEESTRAGSESRSDIKARGRPKSAKPPTYSCKCAATTGVPSSGSRKLQKRIRARQPMTWVRGDVGRKRIIKDRQSVKCYG